MALVVVTASVVCPFAQQPSSKDGASKAVAPPPVPLLPVEVRWAGDLPAPPAADATSDDTRIFVALEEGTVRAWARDSGDEAWSIDLRTSQPLVRSGDALLALTDTALHVVDASSGRDLQTLDLPGASSGALTVAGDVALVPIQSSTLLAMSISSGRELWRTGLSAAPSAPPTVSGDRVVVPLEDSTMTAVSLRDGSTLWTRALRGTLTRAAVSGDRVIVGSSDRHVYAVTLESGNVAWFAPAWAPIVGVAAAAGDVYVVSLDNILRTLDRGNGNERWRKVLEGRPTGAPQVVGGTVVVPGLEPVLATFDARNGTRLPTHAFSDGAALAVSAAPPLLLTPVARGVTTVVLFTRAQILAFGPAETPAPKEPESKETPPD